MVCDKDRAYIVHSYAFVIHYQGVDLESSIRRNLPRGSVDVKSPSLLSQRTAPIDYKTTSSTQQLYLQPALGAERLRCTHLCGATYNHTYVRPTFLALRRNMAPTQKAGKRSRSASANGGKPKSAAAAAAAAAAAKREQHAAGVWKLLPVLMVVVGIVAGVVWGPYSGGGAGGGAAKTPGSAGNGGEIYM